MLRVLIVSELFAPDNRVGAIRMSKIAKYLKVNHQCEISVLIRERCETEALGDAQYVDHILYASESKFCQSIIKRYRAYSSSAKYDERNRIEHNNIVNNRRNDGINRRQIKDYVKSIFTTLYSEYTPRSYCRKAIRVLQKYGQGYNYDVVISSFGPAASHYVGRKIKKENKKIIWIADYRDPPAIGEATKGFLRIWGSSFANRVTKHADVFTVVSQGFVNCLNLTKRNNVRIITNGYDVDDFYGIINRPQITHERLKLVYTGTLFPGARDISIILKALHELICEGIIRKEKLEIVYAGQDKSEFLHQIDISSLNIMVEAHDVVPKVDALKLQYSADLLLISAWNTEDYKGSLPLKIYEYLYVGKPVICSICGTTGNSELKHIIEKCEAGFCYEAATHDIDYPRLKQVLTNFYSEFVENGFVQQSIGGFNKLSVSKYDYKQLAEKYYEIMQQYLP